MQTSERESAPIVGRVGEIARLDELIASARAGRGGVLVLHGEAGMGKSALLDHAAQAASGFDVLRAGGVEFEADLPFAALHQLCVPLRHLIDDLPAQDRNVLRVAFGLELGTPDVFRVGLATLELFALAPRERPLLCVIDDASWLDSASCQALAFLSRRITVEPIAIVFAVRTPCAESELDRLPGLVIDGLSDADARALIGSQGHVLLDEQVRNRIVAEARGFPLALLELPKAGGFAPSDSSSVPTRIERGFGDRLAALSEGARMLLTIASAEPTGNPALLWSAARLLDIDVSTSSAGATSTGLVEFGTRIRFCHPLARSAVYKVADPVRRRRAHRVLAAVTDPILDIDRQVWHRAQAAIGPDDEVAAALDESAARARVRGGVVAAAAFVERAAALSLDPDQRLTRTFAATSAHLDAGSTDAAADLLSTVDGAALDELQLAHRDQLWGRIAFVRPNDANGPGLMLDAARRLTTADPEQARDYLVDVLEMSMVVGSSEAVLDEVLDVASDVTQQPRPLDVLDALTALVTQGHRAAAPLLRAALTGHEEPLWRHRPAMAIVIAAELWDLDTHRVIVEWAVKEGRESGSPVRLRLGLAQLTTHAVLSGDLPRAMSAIAEEEAIADATGAIPLNYPRLQLAAMRGDEDVALALIAEATAVTTVSDSGQLSANVHWTAAILHNGMAEYPSALAAARLACVHNELIVAGLALPELVEAAVRCGDRAVATEALRSLTERTSAGGTASGLGIAAYARALVTGLEENYLEAIDLLRDSTLLPYRGRAHLLYGEWLRREGRRRDCRVQLHIAHDILSGAGIDAFARRAAAELRATGESARSRSAENDEELTMQELHIARVVATGATSNEVANRLFISPRTVETHLRNIFRKLGISSRRQLRGRPELGS